MEGILTWVKQLAYFSVLTSFALRLIPGKGYEKYFRFIAGMLLIVLFLSPLLKLFDVEAVWDSMFAEEVFQYDIKDAKLSDQLYENSRENLVLSEYEIQMKKRLQEEMREFGYEVTDVTMVWNESADNGYAISDVNVKVREIKDAKAKEEDEFDHIQRVEIDPARIEIEGSELVEAISREDENKRAAEIKNYLSRFYNLSTEHIYVSVQGGGRE